MVVKTYRGRLAGGAQEKIPLATKDGGVGYRIIKFQAIAADPMDASTESVTQIWKTSQSSIGNAINFSDTDLLAVAVISHNQTSGAGSFNYVVFDTEIFNQDIFISTIANPGPVNYYIELEQLKLDHSQTMNATLKAIRGQ